MTAALSWSQLARWLRRIEGLSEQPNLRLSLTRSRYEPAINTAVKTGDAKTMFVPDAKQIHRNVVEAPAATVKTRLATNGRYL
jgi:hypothetical protein